MNRRIRVRAIRKEEPNVGLYVLALIALARQLEEQDQRAVSERARAHARVARADEQQGGRS
jgi:hypothetical protein